MGKWKQVLGSLLVVASAQAQAALTVQPIRTQEPGRIPELGTYQNTLWISSTAERGIFLYTSGLDSPPVTVPMHSSVRTIVDDAANWMISCVDNGYSLLRVPLAHPEWAQKLSLHEVEGDPGCAGLAFSPMSTFKAGAPVVWTGSLYNQKVYEINTVSGQILRSYSGVSGPLDLLRVGSLVYVLKGLALFASASPYAFRMDSGSAVWGGPGVNDNPEGLERAYIQSWFDDTKETGKIVLHQPYKRELHLISALNPTAAAPQAVKLSIDEPLATARYGRCLVTMGSSQDQESSPQWSIVRQDGASYKEIFSTPFVRDLPLQGALRMAIDDSGRVFVAGWRGVSQVKGLLEDFEAACR